MADTWKTLAEGNYRATVSLHDEHWRSAVSRAYYAVFGRATYLLLRKQVTMPAGREGPSHATVADLIEARLSQTGRWKASRLLRRLYDLRLIADYQPSVQVTQADARGALTMMMDFFHELRD